MYKKVWAPIVGEILRCCHARKNLFDHYAVAAMKRLSGQLADCTIGNLPREISRIIRFFLLKGGVVSVEIVDKNYRRSPLVQGGLEIPVKLIAEINSSQKNEAIMERLKQLISENYREPDVDGMCRYSCGIILFWRENLKVFALNYFLTFYFICI